MVPAICNGDICMSTTVQNPIDAIRQFYLVQELLEGPANTPLQRWFEYQAYVELVGFLSARHSLPAGYELEQLDIASIRDWIVGGKGAGINFIEKMKELLRRLKNTGDKALEEICEFYCDYKAKLDAGFTTASLILSAKGLAALLAQYKFDFLFFHGIPVTAFASVAIKFGVLDGICECPKPVMSR
jgi:hypothetical protein